MFLYAAYHSLPNVKLGTAGKTNVDGQQIAPTDRSSITPFAWSANQFLSGPDRLPKNFCGDRSSASSILAPSGFVM
jgi:hypothetical protein